MKTTKTAGCNCNSEYQDKQYGSGIRLHNHTQKNMATLWRCTVCGRERPIGG